ncbi:multidrug/hemolysin transport system ATP-binding protein [Atopostipes suicloacalis DSM 15692]|uniref:Multidrug/hemolysin transport system ATP-binding protein n=1 Tax=Atopostipes suicloacalis DSM 15692 TaxID=1121025 RepID=A0A1M4YAG6_9LACT|nr:ABC transporter ATP-binding protein [Atopostipes suicloacalis]SHF02576.1 multidrug/hemolysin transport system ATP-binding protein [Atopostipes suicloacalis DSM 15692]
MENIIEVHNLKKDYGNIEAVKGINFDVKSGSFFAFLGPNGAGKSTTIEMMCTFLTPSSGEIKIGQYKVGKDNEKIREMIGVVFQNNVLDDLLTVEENLRLRGGLYEKNKGNLQELIQEAMEITNITDLKDRPYGELSGGQRRRADLARGLIHRPKVLFLDEPTTGLDPQTRQQVWKTIKQMQQENNLTIFLTTHYMEEAAQADKIMIIDHGEIQEEGTPSQLKEKYAKNKLVLTPKDQTLSEKLEANNVSFEKTGDSLTIYLESTLDAVALSEKYIKDIESYEVLKGSMDDVFLNVTGKELR